MRTSFWTKLLDVVAPRTCVVCGSRLAASQELLCAPCHLHLPLTHYEQQATDNPMARLFWGQFPVERAAALFFYEPQSELSRVIYEMKYYNSPATGEAMGHIAARHFAPWGFFDGIDAIVPIPITRRRRWQRGYNQSEEIACGIGSITHKPVLPHVLKRTHFQRSQTKNHARERMLNVEHAFTLANGSDIVGKHILLVDDIVTTGATVIACGRQLSQVPHINISVLALGLSKN